MNNNLQRQQQVRRRQQEEYYYLQKKREKEEQPFLPKFRPKKREQFVSELAEALASQTRMKNREYLYSKRQWQIQDSSGEDGPKVSLDVKYRIFNYVLEEAMVCRRSLPLGFDLSWNNWRNAGLNIAFEPQSASKKSIKYAQSVAICIYTSDEKIFLHYDSKTDDVGLSLSKTAKYEWLVEGRTAGKSIRCGKRVSLFNTITQDYLVVGGGVNSSGLTWLGLLNYKD